MIYEDVFILSSQENQDYEVSLLSSKCREFVA